MPAIPTAAQHRAADILSDPSKYDPTSKETADHSLPYCAAAALMDGDVYLKTFDEERFTDAALLDLTARVKVHLDDALSARYPRGIPNRITVTTTDGAQLMREVRYPRGHARNPMTDDEVTAKIIKVDTAERKIGLSIKAHKKEQDRGEQDTYSGSQDKFDKSLGARIKDAEQDQSE